MSKSSRKPEPPRSSKSSKSGRSRASSTRKNGGASSSTRTARRSPRSAPRTSRTTTRQVGLNAGGVRIVGEMVSAAALIGGITWAVSAQGSYSPGVIVGLVILGLLAGLGLVTALRPVEVIRRINRLAGR